MKNVIIEQLTATLPPIFSRREICKYLGGLFSVGGLANLDCEGSGPPRVRVGRTVAYEKTSFLEWLRKRFSVEANHE
jgi:hypothetical protein